MNKHASLKCVVAAISCLMLGVAWADNPITEYEPNNPISSPEQLPSPADVSVDAMLGNAGPDDLDYYSFYANAGDVVTVDIDNGIGGAESVDTLMAIFDPSDNYTILRYNDDAPTLDPGSISTSDARIDDFVVPKSGFYTVGVSSYPRVFVNGGGVLNASATSEGDYTLVISGVTTNTKQVAIIVKPGNDNIAPINPRSHGKIPVAILSGPNFDATTIDPKTLRFGSTGEEASLSKCNKQGVDLNGDGRPDLLCHFNTQVANFKPSDAEGKLSGKTMDGVKFEGAGFLKVVPVKEVPHQG